MIPVIATINDVKNFFQHSLEGMIQDSPVFIDEIKSKLSHLLSVADRERPENFLLSLDRLIASFEMRRAFFYVVQLTHPDPNMRVAAQKLLNEYYTLSLEIFWQNKELYLLLHSLKHNSEIYFSLKNEYQRFLDKVHEVYVLAGMNQSEAIQLQIKNIYAQIGPLTLAFIQEVTDEKKELVFTKQELQGVHEDFINSLELKTKDAYKVAVNYHSYNHVTAYCTVEITREKIWKAYYNRAYPVNKERLETVLSLRQELASLLSFPSYAALELKQQMAGSTATVHSFLQDLLIHFQEKAAQECEYLTKQLPQEISLTHDGKIKPWDIEYIFAAQKNASSDRIDIHECFSFDYVLDALFDLIRDYFGIELIYAPFALWHDDDLFIVQVFKEKQLLGHIILDLFSRPGKYTHARHTNIIPALKSNDGSLIPAVSIVIANLAPAHSKDLLLPHSEVLTLFHEFGHALHAVLGATEIAYFSGTRVVNDFIEIPSLMLEEWLWDPHILKRISKHYKTGKALSDDMIHHFIKNRFFNRGYQGERDVLLSLLSLVLHERKIEDIDTLYRELYEKTMSFVSYDPDNHFYTAFTHLVTYNSRYYSYLWGDVYAVNIFKSLADEKGLNPLKTKKYVESILVPGGSKDPTEMLDNFLKNKQVM